MKLEKAIEFVVNTKKEQGDESLKDFTPNQSFVLHFSQMTKESNHTSKRSINYFLLIFPLAQVRIKVIVKTSIY